MQYRSIFVPILIFLNVIVYILWANADRSTAQSLAENFTISWLSLAEGRYWNLITAAFSHYLLWHLALNMVTLYSFGTDLEFSIGRFRFLFFYLTAAIISSLAHSVVSAFLLKAPEVPALGASGAVAGVMLVFALINPRAKILLMGIVPLPALFAALLFIGLDVWGLVAQSSGGGLPIGHGAHLGGAFTGILFYLFYLRTRVRRTY